MTQVTLNTNITTNLNKLFLAFDLSHKNWKLAFSDGKKYRFCSPFRWASCLSPTYEKQTTIIMRYRRANIKGGTYFFTINLANRKKTLLTNEFDKLRSSFNHVKPVGWADDRKPNKYRSPPRWASRLSPVDESYITITIKIIMQYGWVIIEVDTSFLR